MGAAALTPPPACYLDYVHERLVPYGQEEPSMAPVYMMEAGKGFAAWEVLNVDGSPERFVLEHCRTGTELTVILPRYNAEQAANRYEAMVFGRARYTMTQVGQEMEMLGAGVRRTKGSYGDCACDFLGWSE